MPNWTSNNVSFEGKGAEKVYAFLGNNFDFNMIKPMPESLNMEAGSKTDEAVVVYLTDKLIREPDKEKDAFLYRLITSFIDDDWPHEMYNRLIERNLDKAKIDELYDMGERYVSNYMKYGAMHWYDWCNKNWGTKWNANEAWKEEDGSGGIYHFDTAWCTPTEIFVELSKKFPGVTVHVESVDEDGYECAETPDGEYTTIGENMLVREYRNGKIVSESMDYVPYD